MGILKDIGKLAGTLTGAAIGVPIALVGEIVNSDFLQEVGEGVYKVTERTGELLGNVAEGTAETVYGVVTEDWMMQTEGMEKVIDSGATYISGMASGVAKIAKDGIETVDAIILGDSDKAIKVGKEVVKTVAVGTLAVGVADVLDGMNTFDDVDSLADDTDFDDFEQEEYLAEHPNEHHVTPHERELPSGEVVWVDGDGDTTVDTYDGWYQGNPTHNI